MTPNVFIGRRSLFDRSAHRITSSQWLSYELRVRLSGFALVLGLMTLLTATAFGQSSNSPYGPFTARPAPVAIELTAERRALLLAAPRIELQNQSSIDWIDTVLGSEPTRIRAEKFSKTYYQGWIFYPEQVLSSSRVYRPQVVCASSDEGATWGGCQNRSWIKFRADGMEKSIRLDGDLSDSDVLALFRFIDEGRFYSSTDGTIVTSSKIYQIIKYRYAAPRVNVYVRTGKTGPTDVLYFDQVVDRNGLTQFQESAWRGSKP